LSPAYSSTIARAESRTPRRSISGASTSTSGPNASRLAASSVTCAAELEVAPPDVRLGARPAASRPGHLHGRGDRPAPDVLRALTEPLRPYRTCACFVLRVAAGRGVVPGVAGREGTIRRLAQAQRPANRSTTGAK
jgi:hypothetical protein